MNKGNSTLNFVHKVRNVLMCSKCVNLYLYLSDSPRVTTDSRDHAHSTFMIALFICITYQGDILHPLLTKSTTKDYHFSQKLSKHDLSISA